MKLLLTSAGISNDSLATALKKLVKGPIRIAFIPTAANVSDGEKSWLIKDKQFSKKALIGVFLIANLSLLTSD